MSNTTSREPRACRSCALSKAKCVFLSPGIIPNGKCRRCNRLDKACELQTPTLRNSQYDETSSSANTSFMPSSHAPPATTLPYHSVQTPTAPSTLLSAPTAFLGPTSFSSVFEENKLSLEALQISDPLPQQTHEFRNNHFLSLGVRVLSSIPDQASCNTLFLRHINPHDGWIRSAGSKLSDSLFDMFRARKSIQEKTLLTKLICQNTTSVLEEHEDSSQWLGSFSGSNLRWESIGILFTYWAFGAISSPDDDPIFKSLPGKYMLRRESMVYFKECASTCIILCSQVNHSNPLLVYLLYKHSLLESIISGDASLIYWRQHGDLAATTTSLGLHREADSAQSIVSIASEARRRTYAAVFNVDKVIATIMGRPPVLDGRYSSTPLPLDLDDNVLLEGGALLSSAITSLDANGWNTDGQIYSTTILRARTMFSFIRGEILVLALGQVPGDARSIIENLKSRSHSTYAQLPVVIKYNTSDISDLSLTGRTLYSRIVTRLETLQNLFLLERLLIKRYQASSEELINISIEMLGMTSGIWKQRERLQGLHSDFEWLIMYHGVPAAGFLSIELLRRCSNKLTISQTTNNTSVFSVSEVVQSLALLVGFLDWVKPTAPNSSLCYRIRDIVKKVLSQVLDTPPAIAEQSVPRWFVGDEMDFSLQGFDDYCNFDLLDTFDWTQEPWNE